MNTKTSALLLALSACCMVAAAIAADLPRSPAPKDVELYIISPADGATVASPVTVRFGLRGMGVAPAGVAMKETGHHHLLIDTGLPPLNLPIPADDKHVHFGKGQTEAQVALSPGKHTLQLLLADHLHIPHDPPVASKPITIVVKQP
jgi:Domain of unknown function (DUF4399)